MACAITHWLARLRVLLPVAVMTTRRLADGPNIIMAISKLAGVITGPVDLSKTYTNLFVTTANKDLGNQG